VSVNQECDDTIPLGAAPSGVGVGSDMQRILRAHEESVRRPVDASPMAANAPGLRPIAVFVRSAVRWKLAADGP